MKLTVSILAMASLFSGCGFDGNPNLMEDPSYFGQVDDKGETTRCAESFSFPLAQVETNEITPTLRFSSTTNTSVSSSAGDGRCNEVRNHFSGSMIKKENIDYPAKVSIEISFMISDAENKQMAQGLAVDVSPTRASIEYLDRSLRDKIFGIDLRCPKKFSVVCDAQKIDGKKECITYKANYSNQTCAIGATGLPYVFSDNRVTRIDMSGELNLSLGGGAVTVSEISWHGLY